MEKYYLNTLIFFFKSQMETGYKGIEQVLAIIDHKRYSDTKKRELLIETLRYYGLNETDYRDGEFEYGVSVHLTETPSKNVEDIIPIKAQLFVLRLLNGTLELAVPMN